MARYSKYSKPELEQQAAELNAQILAGLAELGIKANLNEQSDGIKIPEYTYDIVSVCEKSVGAGFSHRPMGELEVSLRSIHKGLGCLCHAKRFKGNAKDLVQKVVASVKERRDALVAQDAREKATDKAQRAHGKVLRTLSENYPEFSGNIEHHSSQINLSFRHLTEAEARLILMTLRNAGIKGKDS